jgi:hygromycin-B 4-O-kinase
LNFSLAAALAAAENILGNGLELSAIPGGDDSLAFRVRSGEGTFVLRINRSAAGFEKDAFAFRRFAGPQLPIPRVLQIGSAADHFFCLSEAAVGRTLQDLSSAELPPLLQPTADVLQAIAEAKLGDDMAGYGPFHAIGSAPFQTWHEFLNDIANAAHYDWTLVRRVFDVKNETGDLLDRLLSLADDCPETRALVHGDFGSNNVLTDGEKITAVIDWSEAMFGDPLYDVANIFFWKNWLPCMEEQASYFESRPNMRKDFGDRLLCYQLRIGLAEVYQNVVEGKLPMARWALSRCRQISSSA